MAVFPSLLLDAGRTSNTLFTLWRVGPSNMWNWVPQPHDARLFLLKAREHDALLESGPELACVPLAGAGIEILPVASNHSTLLSFPHVKAVAPEILRRLFLAPRPRAVGGNSDALRLEPVELERTS